MTLDVRAASAILALLLTASAAVTACGSSSASETTIAGDAGASSSPPSGAGDASLGTSADGSIEAAAPDAGPPDSMDDGGDAGALAPVTLAPCPTSGDGGFSAPDASCVAFTPIDTGEPATGENAREPHYALRPTGAAPSTLVLFFIGSGGHPSGAVVASPSVNVYAAMVADGRAVLGLSYANVDSIGSLCGAQDGCYFPTRQSIILGVTEPGSKITVTSDEGVVDRTARALRYLAVGDPGGGWGSFLTTLDPAADPASSLVWSKILVSGHSQGGGHAAAIGKLFPVAHVVQLSSTCDSVQGAAASWTRGDAGTWASDPTQFVGFAAPTTFVDGQPVSGDTTCPYHATDWASFGMLPANRQDDAMTCGNTGDTHGSSLGCVENYATWQTLYQ